MQQGKIPLKPGHCEEGCPKLSHKIIPPYQFGIDLLILSLLFNFKFRPVAGISKLKSQLLASNQITIAASLKTRVMLLYMNKKTQSVGVTGPIIFIYTSYYRLLKINIKSRKYQRTPTTRGEVKLRRNSINHQLLSIHTVL